MRRTLLAGIPLLALLIAPPVHAGIGSALIKAAKLAGKAGSKAGAAGKAAKGGAALKSAKLLTTGIAAERAFLHLPAQGDRVALFLTQGDDGLRAVVRGSDEVIEGAGVRTLVDDLDAMAGASPDAGVDLVLDPSALNQLGQLPQTANTRLWLAQWDGPPLPLDELLVEGQAVKVAWVRPNLAWDLSGALRASFDLSTRALPQDNTYELSLPTGFPCTPALIEAADAAGITVVQTHASKDVVLVDLVQDPELLLSARQLGLHAIQIDLPDLCAVDPASGELLAARVLEKLGAATTWGDVWLVSATDTVPARFQDLWDPSGLVVQVEGAVPLTTFFPTPQPEPAQEPDESSSVLYAGLAAWIVAVLVLLAAGLSFSRRRPEA